MELTAILGLISGIILLLWAITSRGTVGTFWDASAVVIVLGGTLGAVAVSHGAEQIKSIPGSLLRAFRGEGRGRKEIRDKLLELARKARGEGLLALEDDLGDIDDAFLRDAVQLLVDATPSEDLRNVLENRMQHESVAADRGNAVFETAAASSPAFGMIGTLIGLIHMLRDLENPDTIGGGMAVALITTFYGTLFANLVFSPIARKLRELTEKELQRREMILTGVLAIQDGKNPRFIDSKLRTYLPEGSISDEDVHREGAESLRAEEGRDLASDD